jgi:ribosomal protein L11 methyltransferase
MTRWVELSVRCSPDLEEPLAAIVTGECGGVELSAEGTLLRGWLPLDDRLESRLDRLQASLRAAAEAGGGDVELSVSPVASDDWLEIWRANFRPFECAGRFRIRPPWEDPPEGPLLDLVIDPGMAFGTGQHPTTELMLRFLAENPPAGLRVLDAGAGSAILSIAAELLGAREVLAIELDPVAEENARRNIALNGVQERVRYVVGDAGELVDGAFDVVLMNIVAGVIIRLLPSIAPRLAAGGWLGCSGIIEERLEEVLEALQRHGLEVRRVESSGEWRAVLAVKT